MSTAVADSKYIDENLEDLLDDPEVRDIVLRRLKEKKGEDDLGDHDDRSGLIADILESVHGEDVLDHFDSAFGAAFGAEKYAKRPWDPMAHPRGPDGRFIRRGSTAAVKATKHKVREALKGPRTPEGLKALAEHLNLLTVEQLHEVRKEFGLSASGKNRDALIGRLADRLHRGRREEKKEEKAPTPLDKVSPTGDNTSRPSEAPASGATDTGKGREGGKMLKAKNEERAGWAQAKKDEMLPKIEAMSKDRREAAEVLDFLRSTDDGEFWLSSGTSEMDIVRSAQFHLARQTKAAEVAPKAEKPTTSITSDARPKLSMRVFTGKVFRGTPDDKADYKNMELPVISGKKDLTSSGKHYVEVLADHANAVKDGDHVAVSGGSYDDIVSAMKFTGKDEAEADHLVKGISPFRVSGRGQPFTRGGRSYVRLYGEHLMGGVAKQGATDTGKGQGEGGKMVTADQKRAAQKSLEYVADGFFESDIRPVSVSGMPEGESFPAGDGNTLVITKDSIWLVRGNRGWESPYKQAMADAIRKHHAAATADVLPEEPKKAKASPTPQEADAERKRRANLDAQNRMGRHD